MAWYSSTLAALAQPSAVSGTSARALLKGVQQFDRVVHSHSRNGALLWTTKRIVECASGGDDLYLLKDEAVLTAAEAGTQAECIGALLAEIERRPEIVLEATRERHQPVGELLADGFEPQPFEMVYPEGCTFEDGWVYFFEPGRVRALLGAAITAPDPRPRHDDEGEGLEYVFGFLKSHAWLLSEAQKTGLCVAYAEMNPR